ncbi:MAG: carboxypeptidase regulatory-like domain-containing protein, partial [Acidobacteria bacterium]|nr:carboxypeptidase regulatory-like domain-containing protein [Acidobacteriota bacterium]
MSAADTRGPLKRARVVVAGSGTARQARSAVSDERGRFQVSGLAPGAYTISATKAGYVDVMFGQRRAMRNGTPVQIADGQQLSNINLQLPLAGVITGRVLDEDGEPLARSAVSVLHDQYVQGERRLVMAGNDQSDDRGLFRVYGLPPGDYFVSAARGLMFERLLMRIGPNGFDPEAASEETLKIDYAPTYYPGTTTLAEASRIRLAIGQELAGIDVQMQMVPMATVRGVVGGASGGAMVVLIPEDGGPAGPAVMRAQGLRGVTAEDGTFTITRVPPGRYTVVA